MPKGTYFAPPPRHMDFHTFSFEFSHALTEAAKVPCLINSADLEAGAEIVLRLGVARSEIPKQQAANRQKASRSQAQQEKAKKPRC